MPDPTRSNDPTPPGRASLRLRPALPRRRTDRPGPVDAVFVEPWELRRRVRQDASAIRMEDALHRHRRQLGRADHLAWLDLLEEVLAIGFAGREFESLLNEWRRRRARFVGARQRRDADRIFPRMTSMPVRRRWLRRIAVSAASPA